MVSPVVVEVAAELFTVSCQLRESEVPLACAEPWPGPPPVVRVKDSPICSP